MTTKLSEPIEKALYGEFSYYSRHSLYRQLTDVEDKFLRRIELQKQNKLRQIARHGENIRNSIDDKKDKKDKKDKNLEPIILAMESEYTKIKNLYNDTESFYESHQVKNRINKSVSRLQKGKLEKYLIYHPNNNLLRNASNGYQSIAHSLKEIEKEGNWDDPLTILSVARKYEEGIEEMRELMPLYVPGKGRMLRAGLASGIFLMLASFSQTTAILPLLFAVYFAGSGWFYNKESLKLNRECAKNLDTIIQGINREKDRK